MRMGKNSFSQFSESSMLMIVLPENDVKRLCEAREILGRLIGEELHSRDGVENRESRR